MTEKSLRWTLEAGSTTLKNINIWRLDPSNTFISSTQSTNTVAYTSMSIRSPSFESTTDGQLALV